MITTLSNPRDPIFDERREDSMTLHEILHDHPGCYATINCLGQVPAGEPNLEVTVWECEEDSRNDDGRRAIARELVYGEQPVTCLNGEVVYIDDTLLDDIA